MHFNFTDVLDRQRQVFDANNLVAALTVWPDVSGLVNVQLNSGAIAKAVGLVVARSGFNRNAQLNSGHAVKCFF